ncbi:MAG TPA: hypothetical protein VKG43_04735 [Acidimicrobiales bacterium]|nr:hypothetical protein [Acidimicrobiales bacterium]
MSVSVSTLVGGAAAPSGAGFDIVLLAHVAAVVVGFGSVVASGIQAARVLVAAPGAPPPSARRYFVPGVNWAGRVLYAVPVLGFVLLGLSGGDYGLDDGWVLAGLGLWVLVIAGAEGLLWPAEQRVARTLAEDPGTARGTAAPAPGGSAARVVVGVSSAIVVLGLAATILMVAQP